MSLTVSSIDSSPLFPLPPEPEVHKALKHSADDKSASTSEADSSSTISTDPFLFWRLNQESFQRHNDNNLLNEAKTFLGQGLYRQALEKLSLHSDKETVLPKFVKMVLDDYMPAEPSKELSKKAFLEQIDDLFSLIEENEEKGASIFQIMLEAHELFSKDEGGKTQSYENLIGCFKELEISNNNVRAMIAKMAAEEAANRGSFFEALWFLWVMNPFDERKQFTWFKWFLAHREQASVQVAKALALRGAFSLAVRLAYNISNESLQKEAIFAVARQLDQSGFASLARRIVNFNEE